MGIEDDTQHPEDYLKIEKWIPADVGGRWICTGWAPNEKAFKQHAQAIGGDVRALSVEGGVLFTMTEKVPASIDTETNL